MDYSQFLPAAIAAADQARQTLTAHRTHYLSQSYAFETKEDASPVTETDQRVEQEIRSILQAHWPDHGILGEEYGAETLDSEFVWVIDPIDGTRQFIAGIPIYGTLIALCHHGVPILGIVDHPAVQERWIGIKGHPTTLNGQVVTTRQCPDLASALMSSSNTEPVLPEHREGYDHLIHSTKWRVYGAACYAYVCLATGKIDLSVDSGGMREVDYCALVPVIEGAGGKITDWDGQPLTMYSGKTVVAAGNASLHQQAIDLLAQYK